MLASQYPERKNECKTSSAYSITGLATGAVKLTDAAGGLPGSHTHSGRLQVRAALTF